MSYRAIAVHVDQSDHAPARVALAAQLAAAMDTHLTGVAATGIPRLAQAGGDRPAWRLPLLERRRLAQRSLDMFDGVAAAFGVAGRTMALAEDDSAAALLSHARFADLLIVSQHDPQDQLPAQLENLPPYLLLNSGRPLLVTPRGLEPGRPAFAPFSHVLLGWDGSRHAARAIADALPLLRMARSVTLLMLNGASALRCHGDMPGADMALFLARHEIAADMADGFSSAATGATLLNWAADLRCDLLVMGGYGHPRAREVQLGDATRTVLHGATLPVLISH